MAKYIPWNIVATSLSPWESNVPCTCQERIVGLEISDVSVSPAALCLGSDGGTSAKWLPLNFFARNMGQTGSSHCIPGRVTMEE